MTTPYGSKPQEPSEIEILKMQIEISKRDIFDLKDLARRINIKFEAEQKRTRQLQEDIMLSNANLRNTIFQNEDLRERLQHIEAFGIEQRHIHVIRHQASPDEKVIITIGILAITIMMIAFLYAITITLM